MKNALIIGATGGIGGAVAHIMGHSLEDYSLFLVGRNEAALRELKEQTGGVVIPTDIASELEVEALFAELPALDVVVYSAGDIQPEPLAAASSEAYRRVMDANTTGVFLTLKHAQPKLVEGARIFVLGARPELVSFKGFAAYAASKAATAALVKVATSELKRKASLTLVLPKAVATDFWRNVGKPPKDALEPDEVAAAIVESLAGDPVEELRVG